MTGYRSSYFRHDCSEKGCSIEMLPWWDDIIARLPGNIRPTDVDGLTEINRHFLILEQKSCGALLEEGQRQAFKYLAQQPNTMVIYIRTVVDSTSYIQVLWFPETQGWITVTRDEFLGWVEDWGKYAVANAARKWAYV